LRGKRFICFAFILVLVLHGPEIVFGAGEELREPNPARGKNFLEGLENLHREALDWFNHQKADRIEQLENILHIKLFQTNVFFGTVAGIFSLLVVLFVTKFVYNVLRDSTIAMYEMGLKLQGKDTARVQSHSGSPLESASRKEQDPPRRVTRVAAAKKKFLLGDVICNFVNPSITRENIDEALTRQKERNPRPLFGNVLVELGSVSPEEVDKALSLQKRYRQQNFT